MFEKGDRVRCIRGYMNGTNIGDIGTVLSVECDYLMVRWDTFLPKRHGCGGLCENGYGWNVPMDSVEYETLRVDFGELPVLDLANIL